MNDDVIVTSSEGSGSVDLRFVGSGRNWSRASVALARGEGEEHRGRRHGPFGRRSELR